MPPAEPVAGVGDVHLDLRHRVRRVHDRVRVHREVDHEPVRERLVPRREVPSRLPRRRRRALHPQLRHRSPSNLRRHDEAVVVENPRADDAAVRVRLRGEVHVRPRDELVRLARAGGGISPPKRDSSIRRRLHRRGARAEADDVVRRRAGHPSLLSNAHRVRVRRVEVLRVSEFRVQRRVVRRRLGEFEIVFHRGDDGVVIRGCPPRRFRHRARARLDASARRRAAAGRRAGALDRARDQGLLRLRREDVAGAESRRRRRRRRDGRRLEGGEAREGLASPPRLSPSARSRLPPRDAHRLVPRPAARRPAVLADVARARRPRARDARHHQTARETLRGHEGGEPGHTRRDAAIRERLASVQRVRRRV
mmetsp:Transcript_8471/g.31012  ORF Transcript_8471/g.31012 Transcript_8471/m.31012 type:complete len:366 (-) Transcript_8471:1401-2498(-)